MKSHGYFVILLSCLLTNFVYSLDFEASHNYPLILEEEAIQELLVEHCHFDPDIPVFIPQNASDLHRITESEEAYRHPRVQLLLIYQRYEIERKISGTDRYRKSPPRDQIICGLPPQVREYIASVADPENDTLMYLYPNAQSSTAEEDDMSDVIYANSMSDENNTCLAAPEICQRPTLVLGTKTSRSYSFCMLCGVGRSTFLYHLNIVRTAQTRFSTIFVFGKFQRNLTLGNVYIEDRADNYQTLPGYNERIFGSIIIWHPSRLDIQNSTLVGITDPPAKREFIAASSPSLRIINTNFVVANINPIIWFMDQKKCGAGSNDTTGECPDRTVLDRLTMVALNESTPLTAISMVSEFNQLSNIKFVGNILKGIQLNRPDLQINSELSTGNMWNSDIDDAHPCSGYQPSGTISFTDNDVCLFELRNSEVREATYTEEQGSKARIDFFSNHIHTNSQGHMPSVHSCFALLLGSMLMMQL